MKRRTTVGAADELGMSQPAVSNAIKKAEAELGFPLFDRVMNRLLPTEEAKLLFAESEPLFHLYEAFRHRTAQIGAGRIGQLTVAVTSELSESLVPRVLRRFLTQHPEVRVAIEVLPLQGVLDLVETSAADIGLVMAAPSRPGLSIDPLAELPFVVACPAAHRLTGLRSAGPEDLMGESLISAPSSGAIPAMLHNCFHAAGVAYDPAISMRFMNLAVRCVAQDVGLAMVDLLTASSNQSGEVAYVRFEPRLTIEVQAVAISGRPMPRLAERFVRYVRQETAAVISAL